MSRASQRLLIMRQMNRAKLDSFEKHRELSYLARDPNSDNAEIGEIAREYIELLDLYSDLSTKLQDLQD